MKRVEKDFNVQGKNYEEENKRIEKIRRPKKDFTPLSSVYGLSCNWSRVFGDEKKTEKVEERKCMSKWV